MRAFFCALAILLLAAFASAQAGPTPGSQSLEPAFDAADLVCYGFVRSVVPETMTTTNQAGTRTQRMRADIEVRGIYKSALNENSVIAGFTQTFPGSRGGGGPTLSTGQSAILFLKAVRPDTYEFADRSLGAILFSSLAAQSEGKGLEKLQYALVAVLDGDNHDDRLRSFRMLHGFDHLSPSVISRITHFADSKDPLTALWAMSLLVKADVPDSVGRLSAYLDSYHEDIQDWVILNIHTDLAQIRDPKARTALESLTASKFSPIRDGAMRGLRRLRDPRSVPSLVRRLDDSDEDIQYLAVITLAETLGKYGELAPNMALFDKNPHKYKDLWKQWWAEEGSKLYPATSSH